MCRPSTDRTRSYPYWLTKLTKQTPIWSMNSFSDTPSTCEFRRMKRMWKEEESSQSVVFLFYVFYFSACNGCSVDPIVKWALQFEIRLHYLLPSILRCFGTNSRSLLCFKWYCLQTRLFKDRTAGHPHHSQCFALFFVGQRLIYSSASAVNLPLYRLLHVSNGYCTFWPYSLCSEPIFCLACLPIFTARAHLIYTE